MILSSTATPPYTTMNSTNTIKGVAAMMAKHSDLPVNCSNGYVRQGSLTVERVGTGSFLMSSPYLVGGEISCSDIDEETIANICDSVLTIKSLIARVSNERCQPEREFAYVTRKEAIAFFNKLKGMPDTEVFGGFVGKFKLNRLKPNSAGIDWGQATEDVYSGYHFASIGGGIICVTHGYHCR